MDNKWIVVEDERGNVSFGPMNPKERVDADTWYSFYPTERAAAASLLKRLEDDASLWAHQDELVAARNAAQS